MQKKMGPRDWIATVRFIAVDRTRRKRSIAVRIGKPYRFAKRWACPVDSGLHGRVADARGGDSFHALCLAISLVRALVEDFLERGGRILDPEDGTEWPRDSIGALFGWKQIKLNPLPKNG